jgi:aflatoxin B1 aldehyde reductase
MYIRPPLPSYYSPSNTSPPPQFGLSNFTAPDVQNIYSICKAKAYPLPTVYQGNYNPVARHVEADLFPLLRRLDIAFYAYSPLAGGFLVKDAALLGGQGAGRWDRDSPLGQLYRALYGKPRLVAALRDWEAIAAEAGVSRAALAYRWVWWHSALKGARGDACIIGSTRPEQLEETLGDVEAGPLPEEAVERIEMIWKSVEQEAPVDNYNSYLGRREKM